MEYLCREAYRGSPRCAGRRLRYQIRAGRCWPIDGWLSGGHGCTLVASWDDGRCAGISEGGNI